MIPLYFHQCEPFKIADVVMFLCSEDVVAVPTPFFCAGLTLLAEFALEGSELSKTNCRNCCGKGSCLE